MIERRHGHASVDELRETVRDLGYPGDVMNLIVSNPDRTLNCEVKKDVSYGSYFFTR
jgi:hypothetical protein